MTEALLTVAAVVVLLLVGAMLGRWHTRRAGQCPTCARLRDLTAEDPGWFDEPTQPMPVYTLPEISPIAQAQRFSPPSSETLRRWANEERL